MNKFFLVFLGCLLLVSCGQRKEPAPVYEVSWKKQYSSQDYRVKKGDTLYSVAWRFGYDYKVLAKFNHLSPPYPLSVKQTLHLPSQKQTKKLDKEVQIVRKKQIKPKKVVIEKKTQISIKKPNVADQKWYFPTRGKIVGRYSKKNDSNGIEIAGALGREIKASRSGVVAYSGNGLRGYGNLIIIKHNSTFLSAYAFNRKNVVKEGQVVKAGTKIAEMGSNNRGNPLLHFEIRRNGKPVNPLSYLPSK